MSVRSFPVISLRRLAVFSFACSLLAAPTAMGQGNDVDLDRDGIVYVIGQVRQVINRAGLVDLGDAHTIRRAERLAVIRRKKDYYVPVGVVSVNETYPTFCVLNPSPRLTVEVGDIVEVSGTVGMVQNIGLRTSKIKSRDGVSLLIPNSKLVSDAATNWSHSVKTTRFKISVGVAYGSDVELISKVLKESALEHKDVNHKEKVDVMLRDFGDSALHFQLLFFSEEIFSIEKIKSDIRKIIARKFKENHITIPFPQRDLHIKNSDAVKLKDSGN